MKDSLLSSQNSPEKRLALYQAVSRAVNTSLILEDIFNALAQVLSDYIPFNSGRIIVLDESRNNLTMVIDLSQDGRASIQPLGPTFIATDPVMKQLNQSIGILRLTDSTSPSPQQTFCVAQSEAIQLLAPLALKGMLIGCLSVGGDAFSELDENMIADISNQLAIAIENARLYWQTQNQAVQQFLLNQITHAIRKSIEIEAILKTTVKEVGLILGASRCLIHFKQTEEEAETTRSFQYTMPGTQTIENTTHWAKLEQSIFEQRQPGPERYNPYIVNDISSGSLFQDELLAIQVKSYAVFPILIQQQEFAGTISLQQGNVTRAWLDDDIELMKNIAEHLALALYQARLYEEAESQKRQVQDALRALQETQLHLVQSEKMAVLGQFVAGIAHEVNTPLGAIVANQDTINQCLKKLASHPDAETAERMHNLAMELIGSNQKAAERIAEIVHNLRNFARLDESDLKLANLHDGINATINIVTSGLNRKDITIEKHYGELPLIECFPGLLNQVFQNILVNAIQAIGDKPDGKVEISSTYNPESDHVIIQFKDNGKGIPAEQLGRIFDPGFTTKGVGVGTGLGLALCYNIIQKHHGTITAESTVGIGSTMTIELPTSPSGVA